VQARLPQSPQASSAASQAATPAPVLADGAAFENGKNLRVFRFGGCRYFLALPGVSVPAGGALAQKTHAMQRSSGDAVDNLPLRSTVIRSASGAPTLRLSGEGDGSRCRFPSSAFGRPPTTSIFVAYRSTEHYGRNFQAFMLPRSRAGQSWTLARQIMLPQSSRCCRFLGCVLCRGPVETPRHSLPALRAVSGCPV
jgi:hypothetical protein